VDPDRASDGWGALADGTRRAIVSRQADGPQAGGQLAAELPRDQLDTFWQRALASYVDVAEQATEESS
jgi:hypothetical protein